MIYTNEAGLLATWSVYKYNPCPGTKEVLPCRQNYCEKCDIYLGGDHGRIARGGGGGESPMILGGRGVHDYVQSSPHFSEEIKCFLQVNVHKYLDIKLY